MFTRCYLVLMMLTIFVVIVTAGEQQSPATRQADPTDGKLRIIAFGAHPDDCDAKAGGVAAKWAALGHHMKFVSDERRCRAPKRRRRSARAAPARRGAGGRPPYWH